MLAAVRNSLKAAFRPLLKRRPPAVVEFAALDTEGVTHTAVVVVVVGVVSAVVAVVVVVVLVVVVVVLVA